MIKLNTPDFKDEAEEATWWFEHDDELTDHFEQALATGTLGHGTAMRRLGIASTILHLKTTDAELAQAQASERGLEYRAYLEMLLHEALRRRRNNSKSAPFRFWRPSSLLDL